MSNIHINQQGGGPDCRGLEAGPEVANDLSVAVTDGRREEAQFWS